jgi:hypothetical protein
MTIKACTGLAGAEHCSQAGFASMEWSGRRQAARNGARVDRDLFLSVEKVGKA